MCSVRKCVLRSVCVFKQKTAYEMRISDWSSDVCSSDLNILAAFGKCPERIVALHAASGDFAFGHAQKHGLVDLPVNQTLLAEHEMVSRKVIGQKADDLRAWGLCLGQAFGSDVGQRNVHTYQADTVKFVALDSVQFYQLIDQCL